MATQFATQRPDPRLLARRWAALNQDSPITLDDGEIHYLTAMALAADDDLVAHLLLAKLRIAARAADDGSRAARLNSLVEYRDGGVVRLARLMHPTAARAAAHGVSITSLVGAGLIGLGEGQSIAWPDENGTGRHLKVLRVACRDAGTATAKSGKVRQ
jgi:regulator of nucleoside diphosphate kinase